MSNLPPSVTESASHLPSLTICNPHGRARVYLQGAHVAEWRPVGAEEVLWTSVRSAYEPGKPIRGGIPICFPWFGPHASDAAKPAHGFARLRPFSLVSAEDLSDGRTRVALRLTDDEETRALWPHAFALTCTVTVGARLEVELAVTNAGDAPFAYEEALHTYLSVGDVRRATVEGLTGARFVDKADGARVKTEAAAVSFTGETDRLYVGTDATCVLRDGSLGRAVTIDKAGSRSTVVWNPWVAKAARMADFGDHEWPGMACVETANAADDRVTLAAGETHVLRVAIAAGR